MSEISSAYAVRLYEIAVESGKSVEILEQTVQLEDVMKSDPELLKFLSAPTVTGREKAEVLDNIFSGRLDRDLLNFLKVMAIRKETGHLYSSFRDYEELYNKRNNIEKATVVTAVPMSCELSHRLSEKLEKVTGKHIKLVNKVDPRCIGGVVLNLENKEYNDSISHKLDLLRARLADING